MFSTLATVQQLGRFTVKLANGGSQIASVEQNVVFASYLLPTPAEIRAAAVKDGVANIVGDGSTVDRVIKVQYAAESFNVTACGTTETLPPELWVLDSLTSPSLNVTTAMTRNPPTIEFACTEVEGNFTLMIFDSTPAKVDVGYCHGVFANIMCIDGLARPNMSDSVSGLPFADFAAPGPGHNWYNYYVFKQTQPVVQTAQGIAQNQALAFNITDFVDANNLGSPVAHAWVPVGPSLMSAYLLKLYGLAQVCD